MAGVSLIHRVYISLSLTLCVCAVDMAGGIFLNSIHWTGHWAGHWSFVQSVSRHVSHSTPLLPSSR